jgi:predicted nucleic acid-binding protein
VACESGSEAAVAEYRRLRLPRLFFVPLHALEVENAIRQKAFHQRRSLPAGERGHVQREKAAVLARLQRMLERGLLLDVAADWEDAVRRARELSQEHAESTGARSLDLLHVAFSLQLNSELFLTTDNCQGEVAKAEGLKIVTVADAS